MAKPKKKAVGSPKTPNPVKEMQWCFSKHIYVTWEPEAIYQAGYYKQGSMYKVTIRQGEKIRDSGYIYTKDEIIDAVNDTYRKLYQMNHGKTKE